MVAHSGQVQQVVSRLLRTRGYDSLHLLDTLGRRMRKLLKSQGVISRRLPVEETARLQTEWRSVYGGGPAPSGDSGGGRTFDWHSMSYGRVFALSSPAAQHEYEDQIAREYWILPDARAGAGLACVSDALPRLETVRRDIYVMPTDLAWTMVYTHEGAAIGPFFTRRRWVEDGGIDAAS